MGPRRLGEKVLRSRWGKTFWRIEGTPKTIAMVVIIKTRAAADTATAIILVVVQNPKRKRLRAFLFEDSFRV